MEIDDGKKDGPRRGRSGLGAIGVTGTAVALFAVAIFFGARHAGDDGPASAPAPTPERAVSAAPAVAPSPVEHPLRRLEEANRKELESTLPKGAPIEVTANDGDPEALRLAGEIHSFLLAKGYRANDVTRSVSTPPAKGGGARTAGRRKVEGHRRFRRRMTERLCRARAG